jgi:hypothetical protein
VRQKGNPFLQSCNRFLNEYENYCIINCLLELNSPAPRSLIKGDVPPVAMREMSTHSPIPQSG